MLSNDEGRKISFHFLALPCLNKGARQRLAPVMKSELGSSILLASISCKHISHCDPAAQRWPLFSPRDEWRLSHFTYCSIPHQPRQTHRRTTYLWRNGLCLLEDRIQDQRRLSIDFHANPNQDREKNVSPFSSPIKRLYDNFFGSLVNTKCMFFGSSLHFWNVESAAI